MEAIDKFVEEMQRKLNDTINKLIIDDIFDISNGLYSSYDDYVEYKQRIVEMVREHNIHCFNPNNEEYRFTYYAEPVILNEKDFAYIVSKNQRKRGKRNVH